VRTFHLFVTQPTFVCLSYKNEQTKNKHVEIQVLPQSNKTIAVVLAQQVRKGGVSAIVP
jgi:predicted Fe-Mo cluster-binding NifX family protein